MKFFTLLSALFLAISVYGQSDIVISEIMYNAPGPDDIEYLEVTNNTSSAVNFEGITFTSGINYTFPNRMVPAGESVVITVDSIAFFNTFGFSALQWTSGALSNSGEPVSIESTAGAMLDSVDFGDSGGWSTLADGDGASLVLCDLSADNNDVANWDASYNDPGVVFDGVPLQCSPGAANTCSTAPKLGFLFQGAVTGEGQSVTIGVFCFSPGANTSVDVVYDFGASTADAADIQGSNPSDLTLNFTSGNPRDTQFISVIIADDSELEITEELIIGFANPTNNAILAPSKSQMTVTIFDNDTPQANALIITGVFDAQPGAAGAKGIELRALDNIVDLGIYGLSSANNGTGSTGSPEFSFPSVPLNDGECIYVAADSALFNQFFGFDADYIEGAANINGDDAIELFENGEIIDVFGDVDVDGNGQPWEYLDGWAYRKNGVAPSGVVFDPNDWRYSGVDGLDGIPTNNDAADPFPVCGYSTTANTDITANDDAVTIDINTSVLVNVLFNDETPNGLNLLEIVSIPTRGSVMVIDTSNQIQYIPNADECGTDPFVYRICDDNACDTATVTVTVRCPLNYPNYSISEVTTNNANGVADSIMTDCTLRGTVYGPDFRGGNGVQFTIIDATGGIAVFDETLDYYSPMEGDEVEIRGIIDQFAGLTQIAPDTIILLSQNNQLNTPAQVTTLGEDTESEFIRLTGPFEVVDNSDWSNSGPGFNVRLFNPSTGDTLAMRIDNDIDAYLTPLPGAAGSARIINSVIGLGGQFDLNQPVTEGYQVLPRSISDIDFFVNTDEQPAWANGLVLSPNPVSTFLNIQAEVAIDHIQVFNINGQLLTDVAGTDLRALDVHDLSPGMYLVRLFHGSELIGRKFVKQ